MIRKMLRLAVWGTASRKREIIETLHDFGVLHLDLQSAVPQHSVTETDSLRMLRGKLLGMLEILHWDDWGALSEESIRKTKERLSLPLDQLTEEIDKSLDQFRERLAGYAKRKETLQDLYGRIKNSREMLRSFRSFIKDPAQADRNISLWWIDKTEASKVMTSLEDSLKSEREGSCSYSHVTHAFGDNQLLLCVCVPHALQPLAERTLRGNGGIRWRAPVECDEKDTIDILHCIDTMFLSIPDEIKKINEDLAGTALEWGPKLASMFILIDEELEENVVAQRSNPTEEYFLLEGWIPADVFADASAFLKERFGASIFLHWRYPTSDEWQDVPTALSNPSGTRPYQLFISLLRPPTYNTFDPTSFIAFFFPFFAGCMVGDIGYALLIFVISSFLWVKGSTPVKKDVGKILFGVAAWSFLWGIAYGEFFGDIGHRLFHMEPLWVERSHAVLPVMAFSVSLGAAHVLIGLFIGFVRGLREKNNHLRNEKGGNILILLAIFALLAGLKTPFSPLLFPSGIVLLLLGLIFLVAGGGIGGLIEGLGSIGNILSYVRIAAIGLSSAILAMVASKFVDILGISVLGIFIAFLIHVLNFILAIAGSGLHSARLHYVEFMGKFYDGNGKYYAPFARRRNILWKKQ